MSPSTMLGTARDATFARVDGVAFCSSLLALLRRDWAVRVLDADGRLRGYQPWAPYPNLGDGTFSVFILHNKRFPSEDAARLAAAEALWPKLPESIRAELGERP